MNVIFSANQTSANKYRLLLTRTLAMVLNPLSDVVCSTSAHRLSLETVGKLFVDFIRCNKHLMNVPLRDAMDDIDLVGWISPLTLLIRGSTEDMRTIQHAWIVRMLKAPNGFVIKDFGEIPVLNMEKIPQSQFISICQTLHEIISSLNENKIKATFECVINRLTNNFQSVVIPPPSAVRRTLDLLVKERKLDIVEGSYFARNPQSSDVQQATVTDNRDFTPGLGFNSPTERKMKTNEWETDELKVGLNAIVCAENNEKGVIKRNRKKMKGKRRMVHRKFGETTSINDNDSYEVTAGQLEVKELATTGRKEKRFSFLERISRLFKRPSCDEEKQFTNEFTNEEYESRSESWANEHPMNDDLSHLVPDCKTRKKSKSLKGKKRKYDTEKENTEKQQSKVNPRSRGIDEVNCKMNKFSSIKRTTCRNSSLSSDSSSSSSFESNRKVVKRPSDRHKADFVDEDNLSLSETSSFSGDQHLECCSKRTCGSTRKPFHHSPIMAKENKDNNDIVNFCSTQAICGDLELSTPSLYGHKISRVPETCISPVVATERATITNTTMTNFSDVEQSENKDESQSQTINVFQLIGFL